MKNSSITQRHDRLGYLYVALAAILFAASGTVAKFLFNNGLSAFQMIQLRTTLACAGLLVWLPAKDAGLLKIAVKDLGYFAGLGILGIGSAQFFYLFAISKINVAAAILLHYTGPVFVALYAVLVQKRKLGFVSLLAVFGTLVGCFFVVGAYNLEILSLNRAGIVGGFLAAVAFAVYSIFSEYGMRTYKPWTVLLYGMLFAALMWNVLHPPFEAFFHSYSALQWLCIGFVGIFGTVAPFGLYFEGIRRIKPTHASLTATLEPIAAGVIAALFLGETMVPLQIVGGAIVLASIVLLQLKAPRN
ncbi:MAG: DMT family transporter [Deltaproteobacteria bacterium]|nr:DMT family transporter [Deltaproteobacteria bacterium]